MFALRSGSGKSIDDPDQLGLQFNVQPIADNVVVVRGSMNFGFSWLALHSITVVIEGLPRLR